MFRQKFVPIMTSAAALVTPLAIAVPASAVSSQESIPAVLEVSSKQSVVVMTTGRCASRFSVPFMPVRLQGDNRRRPIIKAQIRQQPFTPRVCVRVWSVNRKFNVHTSDIGFYDTSTGPAKKLGRVWSLNWRSDDSTVYYKVSVGYTNKRTGVGRTRSTGKQQVVINY